MKNPIETSLDNLADVSKLIMENAVQRGELSKADITILAMYQREKARAIAVPWYKKAISAVGEIASVLEIVAGKSNKQTQEGGAQDE